MPRSYNPRFPRLLPFIGLDHTTGTYHTTGNHFAADGNGTHTVTAASYNFYFAMQQ